MGSLVVRILGAVGAATTFRDDVGVRCRLRGPVDREDLRRRRSEDLREETARLSSAR